MSETRHSVAKFAATRTRHPVMGALSSKCDRISACCRHEFFRAETRLGPCAGELRAQDAQRWRDGRAAFTADSCRLTRARACRKSGAETGFSDRRVPPVVFRSTDRSVRASGDVSGLVGDSGAVADCPPRGCAPRHHRMTPRRTSPDEREKFAVSGLSPGSRRQRVVADRCRCCHTVVHAQTVRDREKQEIP